MESRDWIQIMLPTKGISNICDFHQKMQLRCVLWTFRRNIGKRTFWWQIMKMHYAPRRDETNIFQYEFNDFWSLRLKPSTITSENENGAIRHLWLLLQARYDYVKRDVFWVHRYLCCLPSHESHGEFCPNRWQAILHLSLLPVMFQRFQLGGGWTFTPPCASLRPLGAAP